MFKWLFGNCSGEMMFVKLTRPMAFWLLLISFLTLLFLNSFGAIKTDVEYLDILKQLLMIMTGFYFTGRTIEKVAALKKKKEENKDMPSDLDTVL